MEEREDVRDAVNLEEEQLLGIMWRRHMDATSAVPICVDSALLTAITNL